MSMFDNYDFANHEQVVFCHDKEAGLYAIIAIHNTNLGPAAGGCRMWDYASFDEAVVDALRLSKGMSYKSAIAGLACGGGKSVIIGDPHMPRARKTEILRAFARYVQSLGGRYYAAEDVGIGLEDIKIMMEECDYVFGLPDGSGDPSPVTARGVFEGLRATVKHKLGRDDLSGIKVAVQGVGHVGYHLCKHLHAAGAELFVTDIHQDSIDRAVQDFGATATAPDAIYGLDVDIYAPCALGATLNDATIAQLKVSMVVGAANNQLQRPVHGQVLHDKGILYAPDYVANAGGMINASGDIFGNYDYALVMEKVASLYDTLLEIYEESERSNRPTYEIADEIAEARLRGELPKKAAPEPAIGD